ncbi:type I-F CRISPR-associated protein Csy1 [Zymomonas mobilis]|uniref:type I-F CRISPR-associated protein Csy1 n=1 Tax=Zymomonas mobilis TaxID=542 RepID=UPI0021C38A28|nr:type I-F CRISPR-associated protein Csy1 [Zymomonas mobilis]MCP9307343.1 type I-F CRISPR-associated protein Csy1 [Zymomonas mobilis]
MQHNNARIQIFRQAISDFIENRRDEKLKGKADDPAAMRKYDYAIWLEDAARRVGQIHAATHIAKAIHSSAKGSNLYIKPDSLPQREEIGSHLLDENFDIDIVGNAAALDVFKFLKTKVEDKTLLAWAEVGDPDFKAALSKNPDQAEEWISSFAGLLSSDKKVQSHALMKQLYWLRGKDPTEDDQYILLQPLFPSALVNYVHQNIQAVRFGESNKKARSAFYKKEASELVYQEYKKLAVQRLGGTKPQNISQLNSERGGVNYLLASLPPRWKNKRRLLPLNCKSALDVFFKRPDVYVQVDRLIKFLKSNPPDNLNTRQHRQRFEQKLTESLVDFAAAIKAEMPVGWSREDSCQLHMYERLWLDPERSLFSLRDDSDEADQIFYNEYMKGDWPDAVAQNFGRRLNAKLKHQDIPVGETEYIHWVRQVTIDAAWPVPWRRRA